MNAFGDLALDATLRELITLLRNQHLANQPGLRPYARTAADQLRVVIDGGATHNTLAWGEDNARPAYYGAGAPTSMDARHQQAEASHANFLAVRHHRWRF